MKTEGLKNKGNWGKAGSDCCLTVGKPLIRKEPSTDFYKKKLGVV